jgi:hypothetical protein
VDPTTGKVDDVTLQAHDEILVREKNLKNSADEPAPPASAAKP